MTSDLVTVEKADRIAIVRFDRGDPANSLNATASHADMDEFVLTQNSEDCAEGLRAFLEKRDPVFTGR
jgi:enoyl-CoA hydratase/carnithine racemase